jgi:hypothetical protein
MSEYQTKSKDFISPDLMKTLKSTISEFDEEQTEFQTFVKKHKTSFDHHQEYTDHMSTQRDNGIDSNKLYGMRDDKSGRLFIETITASHTAMIGDQEINIDPKEILGAQYKDLTFIDQQ